MVLHGGVTRCSESTLMCLRARSLILVFWIALNKVVDSISVFQKRQLVVLIYKKHFWVAGKQEGQEVEKDSLQTKPTYAH